MGQINTNNYPTVDSLADVDLLIVENATHGTGTTTPKQLRENAIGTTPLQTTAQTVTGAINELKNAIDAGSDVKCYDIDTISSGYLGEFDGKAKLLLLHLTTDGTADATNGYTMLLSYSGSVARMAYGQLYDREMQMEYDRKIYNGSTLLCEIMDEGTGTEADPIHVDVLGTIDGYVTAGWDRQAALGDRATAEGIGTDASGNYAHAQGYQTTASGNQSTAMGYSTTASADGATAMGNGTTASGANSIAGGYNTTASGAVSTAIGTNTQATQQAQLATGKYNKTNNDALVMVGNGTSGSARSNALEVLLNGDVVAGNDIIDGQGNTLSVLAEALTKTASGNPVVIDDCAGGKARSLKTTIEAIQDLHGYDHPWAGGAGKNKAINFGNSGTSASRIYTENADGSVTVTGTSTAGTQSLRSSQFFKLKAGTYTVSGCNQGATANDGDILVRLKNGSTVIARSYTNSPDATFTLTEETELYYDLRGATATVTSAVYTFYPQIEEGSVATSYMPYKNICPISGRTEARVDDVGKNQLDASAVTQGSFDDPSATANCVSDYIPVSGGTDYYMSGNSGYADGVYLRFYDANKAELDTSTRISKYVVAFGFTAPSTAVYTRIMWYKSGGLTPTNVVNALAQLEIGATATAYVPYAHSSATIQLGTTVYGADINWDTGVATVKTAKTTLTNISQLVGELQSSTYGNWIYLFVDPVNGYDETSVLVESDRMTGISYNDRVSSNYYDDNRCYVGNTGAANAIVIRSARSITFNSKSDFFDYFKNAEFKYQLATPTTIQLTPTQLQMLKGYNRVSIDNGSIELGYIAKIA